MAKTKTHFVCSECGTVSLKWLGKCPGCESWNTFTEEPAELHVPGVLTAVSKNPEKLIAIDTAGYPRISTGIAELDRVFGGGLTPGSVTLLGGQPGIGKSTLLLQVSDGVCSNSGTALYISGEESPRQIKIRAERLGIQTEQLYVLSEINLEKIIEHCRLLNPTLIIIDSIQTLYRSEMDSAPGSVGQVRECTSMLVRMAKEIESSLIIVGHVTKDGSIAGPRVLEHLVDTVLYFEGENIQNFRLIKSVKNRFGSTNEIGIFEMEQSGLQAIANPSEYFLSQRSIDTTGNVIIPVMEGTRAILVELQALVSKSFYPAPARKTKGIDANRLAMIVAVLEKRAGIPLATQDIYINVAGGLEIDEPAVDLGVAMAIVSSFADIPLKSDTVFLGEIGLGGEIRGVSLCDRRIMESSRLGFKNIIIPQSNARPEHESNIKITALADVRNAVKLLLGKNSNKRL